MSKFLQQLIIIVFTLSIVGCSTQKLFNIAIDLERSRADLEAKSIELEFGKIAYLDNNIESDTTIVLLHGFGGDKDNWNKFSTELNDTYRIIIPDLPGHGESVSNINLDYSTTHQSKMLSTFLDALNVKKIHIAGNSMGGAIAIRYSIENVEKVNSLTLIDSLGMKKTKSEFDLILEKSGLNPMINVCTEEAFNKLLYLGMNEPPYIPGIFMDMLVSRKCARAGIERIIYGEMIKDSNLDHIVINITVPTIIIWGKKDRVLHVDNAGLFHDAINGSKLVLFEKLGHVSILEDPEKSAQIIEKFIKENN